jgi:DNA mismatch repair protein MutS
MASDNSIYKDYINYTRQYQEKYGKQCIVLLQVGAFFEVYGFKNIDTQIIEESEILEFSQICNLNISEKKFTYDNRQVQMAGFRDYTLDKYLQKLTEHSYTAVVYVQQKEGKQITRVLDSIHSPGTYMSYENDNSQQTTNNIACIWIDIHKSLLYSKQKNEPLSKMRDNLVCGIAVANIFTGKSFICEFQESYVIEHTTFDELERTIVTHSPTEILFVSSLEKHDIDNILQFIGIQHKSVHIISSQDHKKAQNCQQQQYIAHILSKFYGEESLNICVEFQTYPTATQSFCFLLDFVQEHNPNLVKNISIPDFHKTTNVILANHTLNQLNIIEGDLGKQRGNLSSVNAFLNKCNSSMGRRRFYHQLVSPTTDEIWLQREYSMITKMMTPEFYEHVPVLRKYLGQTRDIEKICRQLSTKRLYPSSVYYLHQTIQLTQTIYNIFKSDSELSEYWNNEKNDIMDQCIELSSFLETSFDIPKCQGCNSFTHFEEVFIRSGISEHLDGFIKKYDENMNDFHEIHRILNKTIQQKDQSNQEIEYVKIHSTEKLGMSFQITKKRSLLLKKIIKGYDGDAVIEDKRLTSWKEISFKSVSGSCDEIEIPFISKICNELVHQKEQINKYIGIAYFDILTNLEELYYPLLENLAQYLSKVDVLQTKAYIAKENHYCCPKIDDSVDKPFIDAKALRHVLIEHLQTNEIYVPNDIVLGKKDESNGILLYGTNAVGKTSFIRAIGISIIMAQSGMFVPCSQFTFKPYHSIFSRILGNDNLFKGLSTFAVEMSELRVILKMSDENSLVLGDELCSGTETESALSIFVSGLIHLHEKQSSHIFATHFHEIIHYEEIQNLHQLALKHMAVYYDREEDMLVYDRKLQDGPGNRMYGLEVCKSLHLDDEFLNKAYEIRSKYFPETHTDLNQKKSRYNAKKIRGMCEICQNEIGQEVHHLQPQKDADDNGFIENSGGVFHKNHVANLMNVCESCHDEYHREDKSISRKKTTKGYKLV